MKKLLLGALILSANVYSLSFVGTSSGSGAGHSGGSISFSQGTFSGNVTILSGDYTLTLNPTDKITAGTVVTVNPGASFKAVDSSGNVIGTISGGNSFSFTNEVKGTDTSFATAPATPSAPTTPTPPAAPAPSTPSTPAPAASTGKPVVYIPRSKVDLDLVKNTKASVYRNLEGAKSDGHNLSIEYAGGLGGKFNDKGSNIKYNSKSNGVLITISRNFGKFTLGGGLGYHESKVRYKENFNGTKENVESLHLVLSGKYDFTDNVDLAGVMTYSNNKHKFATETGFGNLHDARYNSRIFDFDTRLGYKFISANGYIKPYIGLGVTSVNEGAIDKIKAKKASESRANGTLGLYGQVNLGAVDLFGNLEYEQRFGKTLHGKREYTATHDVAALDYNGGAFNLGLGLKYRVSDTFNLSTTYELNNSKNSVFKLGFGAEF